MVSAQTMILPNPYLSCCWTVADWYLSPTLLQTRFSPSVKIKQKGDSSENIVYRQWLCSEGQKSNRKVIHRRTSCIANDSVPALYIWLCPLILKAFVCTCQMHTFEWTSCFKPHPQCLVWTVDLESRVSVAPLNVSLISGVERNQFQKMRRYRSCQAVVLFGLAFYP